MPDMLVKLYDLPAIEPALARIADQGVSLRRPMAHEKHAVVDWVRREFGEGWASECDVAFSRAPVACFIALANEKQVVGFACYDCAALDFFGPTGVKESERGKGIGAALLLKTLYAMHEQGYGYAIIGGAGPMEFYRRHAAAVEIPGSKPGVYPAQGLE
jgi:predicted N-acetyltransferase YhbS